MKIERTEWRLPKGTNITSCVEMATLEQPAIGFKIAWNDPKQFWKPFVTINIWCWVLQIGWLVD